VQARRARPVSSERCERPLRFARPHEGSHRCFVRAAARLTAQVAPRRGRASSRTPLASSRELARLFAPAGAAPTGSNSFLSRLVRLTWWLSGARSLVSWGRRGELSPRASRRSNSALPLGLPSTDLEAPGRSGSPTLRARRRGSAHFAANRPGRLDEKSGGKQKKKKKKQKRKGRAGVELSWPHPRCSEELRRAGQSRTVHRRHQARDFALVGTPP